MLEQDVRSQLVHFVPILDLRLKNYNECKKEKAERFNYFYPCLRGALKYIQGSWNRSPSAREKMNSKRQAKKKK